MTARALLGVGMPPGISLCVQLTWGKHQWESHAESADATRRCAWWAELQPQQESCLMELCAPAAPLAPAPYHGPSTTPRVASITPSAQSPPRRLLPRLSCRLQGR